MRAAECGSILLFFWFVLAILLAFGAVGCSSSTPSTGKTGSGACEAGTSAVVSIETDDHLMLAADLYTTGKKSSPGVVLLHMVPPSNTRANYPPAFIDALVRRGLNVLNVDRRGAGASQGNASDAYKGPLGMLDAKAARQFLVNSACMSDRAHVAIVGASNGSTSALDDSVASPQDPPAALVFLTGGTYTENQNKIADHRDLLAKIPILFVFSTDERTWSAGFMGDAPPTWVFKEYAHGDHGTRMFAAEPQSIDDVADFLASNLLPRS